MHPNGKGVSEVVKRMIPSVEELITKAASRREPQPKS
jgi:hypothetical protein